MLRSYREARRWTRARLCDELTLEADRLSLRGFTVTEKTISRWEGPNPPNPRADAARVLESVFGVPLSSLGLSVAERPSDIAVSALWRPEDTLAEQMNMLADPSRRKTLVLGGGLLAYVAKYFVMPISGVPHVQRSRGGPIETTAAIRYMLAEIKHLDSKYGSGGLAGPASRIADEAFDLLRNGDFPEAVEAEIFSVAADAASFAGWLHWDAGAGHQAQQLFKIALQAARHGHNDVLAANIMGFMSIQAYNRCDWRTASQLAGMAESLLQRSSPAAQAAMLTRRSRSHAGAGEIPDARIALDRAFEIFETAPHTVHDPDAYWVTLGELHGQGSHPAKRMSFRVSDDLGA